MSLKKIDVIVIGAGAAGMMCAIEAGKRNRNVIILDHANKPGKKILMSGGGRCNFTNSNVKPEHFISNNTHFSKSALSRYQPHDFIKLVKNHHIPFHEKTLGQQFCDNKSKDIVNMLLAECEQFNVHIKLNNPIKKITPNNTSGFIIETDSAKYLCDSLVIATGGLSIPTLGASPFGYKVAEQFGLKVWPTRAGLVPFTLHQKDKDKLSSLSGISINCTVSTKKQSFTEAMLFTHRGLSGPAMLQISSYWTPGDPLQVDFLPENNLKNIFKAHKDDTPQWTLKRCLTPFFSKKQISLWVKSEYLERKIADCSKALLDEISASFHQWQISPNGTEGYRTAEVTLGGVDCNAVSSKTFETNSVKGLYFIGEVLDVSGWLGGYNFQWAWASGFAAGQHV